MKSLTAIAATILLISANVARSASPPPSDAVFDVRYACLYGQMEGEKVSLKERADACDEFGRLESAALELGYCWNQARGEYVRCD